MIRRLVGATVLISLGGLFTSQAGAASITWTIISSASFIKLNIPDGQKVSDYPLGTATPVPITLRIRNQSGATTATWSQGNLANLTGSFPTETDEVTSIKFKDNLFEFIDVVATGSYNPELGNPPPDNSNTAIGDYGGRFMASIIGINDSIFFALREVLYHMESDDVPITGGTFPASAVKFGFDNGTVAYHGTGTFDGAVGSGLETLSTQLVDNASAKLATIGYSKFGQALLVLPIDVLIKLELADWQIDARLEGQITATWMPEPSSYVLLLVGAAAVAPWVLRRCKPRAPT